MAKMLVKFINNSNQSTQLTNLEYKDFIDTMPSDGNTNPAEIQNIN